ncbi:MAG: hypothetical protein AAGK97_15875, partial [Bacteroidota bacterium]
KIPRTSSIRMILFIFSLKAKKNFRHAELVSASHTIDRRTTCSLFMYGNSTARSDPKSSPG